MIGVDDRRGRARVVVHVADPALVQIAVHHDAYGAHLDRAEERGGEVRHVGQTDQDALLRAHTRRLQGVGKLVGAGLERRVGDRPVARAQRDAFAASLPHAVVQEVVGDIERVGRRERHRTYLWVAMEARSMDRWDS